MSSQNKLITDIFIDGARKGWDIAIHSTIPNVLMAFVIIYILNVSGLLKTIGEWLGFIMAPVGLPGEAIAVFLAAFLSWGGAAGVLVALVQEGALNAHHVAILLPGMALVGSTVQYMGRILGVLGVPGKHYLVLFGLNLQSKCNKKRSTHQLEYNFVSTQKPLPNDEYFLPTSYNKRARKDNDFTRTGQKTSRNCQSTGT